STSATRRITLPASTTRCASAQTSCVAASTSTSAGSARQGDAYWRQFFRSFWGLLVKKLVALAAAFSALAFGTTANAADLPARMPVKAAPMVAPAFSWTGFYLGAQIGWSHIRDTQDLSSPSFAWSVSDTADGFLGGVHGGYNLQISQFVLGVEADFEGNTTNHTFLVGGPFSVDTAATEKLRWQGSLRGR